MAPVSCVGSCSFCVSGLNPVSSICTSYPRFTASCQSDCGLLLFSAGKPMKTPELSSGCAARQSSFSRKSLNCSRVYQSRPMPPCDSTTPLLATNPPLPAICHPARSAGRIARNSFEGCGWSRCTIASAVFLASTSPVRLGLADPQVGNSAGPATYALSTCWKRPSPPVTAALSPIQRVPDSWCVVPILSRAEPSGGGFAFHFPPYQYWMFAGSFALDAAAAIAKDPANIQYWYGGKWNAKPQHRARAAPSRSR